MAFFFGETSCSIGLFSGCASRPRDFSYADLLEMLFPGELSSNAFLLFARMYLTLFCKFPHDVNLLFRKQVAVIRCVGSRDSGQSRHHYAIWAHAMKRKGPLCLGWDYAIQQNKSNRDALCGLTWLKEENRYALCGQQKKRIVRRWVGPRD